MNKRQTNFGNYLHYLSAQSHKNTLRLDTVSYSKTLHINNLNTKEFILESSTTTPTANSLRIRPKISL